MPIINIKTKTDYGIKIFLVKGFIARLSGLIGTEQLAQNEGLYFTPCSGIHTFGMRYAIDAVFLNRSGCVIHCINNLKPNKVTKIIPSAAGVLELSAGFIRSHQIQEGDCIQVQPDREYKPSQQAQSFLFHWPVNIAMALLWGAFVFRIFHRWIEIGGIVNLGIVVHNTILFMLFLTRRRSKDTSRRIMDWIVPTMTVASAMLLNPIPFHFGTLQQASLVVQIAGLAAMIFSVLSLGKSFGIIPANRQVKNSGAYRFVRHPLYASEILFHLGFLLGNYSIRNICIIALMLSGQIWRALSEEKLLSNDPVYNVYRNAVRFRFVPGIF
jgi:protein-S-isoprenylcysteine O-methyltransferase Ste14/uncharacterized membrane protein (UPF0127 family)